MSNNKVCLITESSDGSLSINGVLIIEADVPVDNGALYIIDGVLQ